MGAIRIVHCSDPHFGAIGQSLVWSSFLKDINSNIKPHLVLITGDVSHTPKLEHFSKARTSFDAIIVDQAGYSGQYLVCTGNHDCHPFGNAIKPARAILERVMGYSGAPAWFHGKFNGRIPTVEQPIDLPLADGSNRWSLRVLGIDTSSEAKFSAQGYVSHADIENLPVKSSENADVDLVVVMHHHHLLPIAELETGRQSVGQLFKPTVMHNAGHVLRALSKGHVNLVLHGHEHHRCVSRFSSSTEDDADLVVLGAGSCTGNLPEGCELSAASYNVIELHQDRSVSVRERHHTVTGWDFRDQPSHLLDSRAIRRARFYRRRTEPVSAPASSFFECFDFKIDRSIDLTQRWTDWVVEDGAWSHETINTSGRPAEATARFEWSDGATETLSAPYRPRSGQDHTYHADFALAKRQTALARSIVLRHHWDGGATLTRGDLSLISEVARGNFRSTGREWVATAVRHGWRTTSMLVRLPPSLAPDPSTVEVRYAEADGAPFLVSLELSAVLQHHAPGLFSIEIPYPVRGCTYALTWPVADDPPTQAACRRFADAARGRGRDLLEAFARRLSGVRLLDCVTLALYLPDDDRSILRRHEEISLGQRSGPSHAPYSISLQDPRPVYRLAWWGTIQRAINDPSKRDPDFLPGEIAMAVIPIGRYTQEVNETWGLVRVGICETDTVSQNDLLAQLRQDSLIEVFNDGIVSLLDKVTG